MPSDYYVTDTHAFLWYLTDSPSLSSEVRSIFELCESGAAKIVIPAIVLLECIDILDKKKVSAQFEDIVLRIVRSDNLVFADLDWALVLEVNKIKGFKDLHDRVIVATAQLFNATLLSRDQNIRTVYKRTLW